MIRFGLFGVGFIGTVHANNIIANPRTTLGAVYDPDVDRARAIADRSGAHVATGTDDLLAQPVDAVIIASSTSAHAEQLIRSAKAGKAVICEKPIHNETRTAVEAVRVALAAGVPNALGFNRRYAREHALLKEAVASGRLGKIETMHVVCRTAEPPEPEMLVDSGGFFRISSTHFFDLACWIAGELPTRLVAYGNAWDPPIAAAGELDIAAVLLKMQSGALVTVSQSFHAVSGYDERIEVKGSKAMAESGCKPLHDFRVFDAAGSHGSPWVADWFPRMEHTYMDELDAFVDALEGKPQTNATLIDGLRAQILAEAADRSEKENISVVLDWTEVDALARDASAS